MTARRIALGLAGIALAPALASAQPASTYQLPPASPSPAPRAAGPVEEGAAPPTVATPRPTATPAPEGAAPAIVLPSPAATAAPGPTGPARTVPRAAPVVRATPDAAPAPTASAPNETAPARAPAPRPAASPTLAPPVPGSEPALPPVAATQTSASALPAWWPWAAGGVALALAGGAIVLRRRRTPVVPEIARPAAAAAPAAEPVAPASPPPEPAPAPEAAPALASPPPPRTDPSRDSDPLVLVLHATRLSATLVNTTLAYRIVALNRGRDPLEDIAIGGDMIAAHASRAIEEQLGLVGPELPPIHRIERLEPGSEVVLEGEMKLPLTAVMPIRHAEQALFVPLARLDAWASAPEGRAVRARAAWIVGQEAKPAAARLQPFRLDLGPRIWGDLGQRPLSLPGA